MPHLWQHQPLLHLHQHQRLQPRQPHQFRSTTKKRRKWCPKEKFQLTFSHFKRVRKRLCISKLKNVILLSYTYVPNWKSDRMGAYLKLNFHRIIENYRNVVGKKLTYYAAGRLLISNTFTTKTYCFVIVITVMVKHIQVNIVHLFNE